MSDEDKLKNIFSFLCIMFGNDMDIMERIYQYSPEYIMEKYERYVKSDARQWPWGMHPLIKKGVFSSWLKKHNVEVSEDAAENW